MPARHRIRVPDRACGGQTSYPAPSAAMRCIGPVSVGVATYEPSRAGSVPNPTLAGAGYLEAVGAAPGSGVTYGSLPHKPHVTWGVSFIGACVTTGVCRRRVVTHVPWLRRRCVVRARSSVPMATGSAGRSGRGRCRRSWGKRAAGGRCAQGRVAVSGLALVREVALGCAD